MWWPFRKRSEAKGITSLDLFRTIYGGTESRSGVAINWKTATEVATVLACARVRANGLAQVPFRLYRDDGTGRSLATDHPLFSVLHRRPNPWQTSFGLRETLATHMILTGNAFAWKGMVGTRREVRSLEPIEPGRVTVKKGADGELTYKVAADDGSAIEFGSDEIWHIRGSSWNAWLGLDATRLARDAIGLAIATESSQADYHKGNARISGLLAVDEQMGPEKFEFLAQWLDRHSDGGDRAGKPLIADLGAKWTPFGLSGVDAQHLETRKHQIEEICRAFNVLPIMVGHADKTATYASAEQMFMAHVVHTLAPDYARLEQSADTQLLTEAEREAGFYTKFTPNALMRGAASDRAAYYTAALGDTQRPGWMTRNDVRRLEELEPVEDGDVFPELITAAQGEDDNGTD